MKTKIKSYTDEDRDFHDKEMPKIGPTRTCLVVTQLILLLKKKKNYYQQLFKKFTEKEVIKHITKNLMSLIPIPRIKNVVSSRSSAVCF